MPKKPDFIFEVSIRISEAFTLDSIIRRPRTFKPKDVQSACQNNEIVCKSGNPPQVVEAFATYIMTDFFALAHGTGLYNRQMNLWEALSKVTNIQVRQLTSGVFKREPVPIFDFAFMDYKGKVLIYALLVNVKLDNAKKEPMKTLKSFIGRAQSKPGLSGAFACYPKPFPDDVLQFLQQATETGEPLGRYESKLPALKCSLDLLEMSEEQTINSPETDPSETELRTVFSLVHPDLKKSKSTVYAAATGQSNRKKPETNAVESKTD